MRYADVEFHKVPAGPMAVTPQEVNVNVERDRSRHRCHRAARIRRFLNSLKAFSSPKDRSGSKRRLSALQRSERQHDLQVSTPDGKLSVFKNHSGYSGKDIAEYGQPGSNGLTLDPQGRLTINEHGNRRVTRIEKDGRITVLADRYEGKRLNSPNDLVYRSDGALFFTDPPFGLPKFYDDPRKELALQRRLRLKDGKLKLVSTDLKGPNGIAFSPDEKYLYVGNWDPADARSSCATTSTAEGNAWPTAKSSST